MITEYAPSTLLWTSSTALNICSLDSDKLLFFWRACAKTFKITSESEEVLRCLKFSFDYSSLNSSALTIFPLWTKIIPWGELT